MRGITASLGAGIILAMAEPAYSDERTREIEAFMGEYLRLWSAGDAKTITEQFHRFDRPHPWQQEAELKAEFDRRRAGGAADFTNAGVESCLISRTEAMTELRVSRHRAEVTPLIPADQTCLYLARRFQDGWRITNYIPMSPTANLNYRLAAE